MFTPAREYETVCKPHHLVASGDVSIFSSTSSVLLSPFPSVLTFALIVSEDLFFVFISVTM